MKTFHLSAHPIRIDADGHSEVMLRSTVPFVTGHHAMYCADFAHSIHVDRAIVVRTMNPEAVGQITVRARERARQVDPQGAAM